MYIIQIYLIIKTSLVVNELILIRVSRLVEVRAQTGNRACFFFSFVSACFFVMSDCSNWGSAVFNGCNYTHTHTQSIITRRMKPDTSFSLERARHVILECVYGEFATSVVNRMSIWCSVDTSQPPSQSQRCSEPRSTPNSEYLLPVHYETKWTNK